MEEKKENNIENNAEEKEMLELDKYTRLKGHA